MMTRKDTRDILVVTQTEVQQMLQRFMDMYTGNELTPEVQEQLQRVVQQQAQQQQAQGAVQNGNLYGPGRR